MRMTIGRKLALGFGVLIILVIVVAAVVFGLADETQKDMRKVADVGTPLSASTFEMEINTLETGFYVLQYVDSGDPQYRDLVDDSRADFGNALEEYGSLSRSEGVDDHSGEISTLYNQYLGTGQSLIDTRDNRAALLSTITTDFAEMDRIIHEDIQAELDPSRLEFSNTVILLETDIAEVGTWLGNYLVAPSEESRDRISDNIEDARTELSQSLALELTEAEVQRLDDLGTRFEDTVLRINTVLDLSDQLGADTLTFLSLQTELNNLLDDEIQTDISQTNQTLIDEAVNDTQNIIRALAGLVLFGLLIAAGVVAVISRTILGSVSELRSGTEKFGAGQLTHRIALRSQDELGDLALSFNQMAEQQYKNVTSLDLARREAQDATRMKDLFMATMSHELRTPLNAMIGFLHLMLYSGQLDEDNSHMAQRSLANTQRLLTLINNILDLSRIATGGLQIVPKQVTVRPMAASLYNDMKFLAQDKGVDLELEVDASLPNTIVHDEDRIAQIVTNLVNNAIKFTQKGKVVLAFENRTDRLIIRVTDTGIGIPISKQALIFDDFFQVDATSARQYQGAGLGLAIVRRLALLMNGTVAVSSEVDKGSIFIADLPLNLPTYDPTSKPEQVENIFPSSGGRLAAS
jgi:signal transduction histidine kinase